MYRSLTRKVSRSAFTLLVAVGGCTQKGSPRAPGASPEPSHDTAIAAEAESWLPRIAATSRQYFLRDSAVVSINNDTTARVLPIETTLSYSINIAPSGDSFSISGKIDSLTISSRLQTKSWLRDSTKTNQFNGTLSKQGVLRMSSQQQSLSCSSASNSAISRVHEMLIPLPKGKTKIGDSWTDTVISTTCHGRTPLTQTTVREFQAAKFTTSNQRSAIEIKRTSAITFSGASTEINSHLSASGSGSGEAMLLLDRETGVLLESNGHTKSVLTIVTSRGQFPFTQLTSTYITTQ